jgi:hypothetical protein
MEYMGRLDGKTLVVRKHGELHLSKYFFVQGQAAIQITGLNRGWGKVETTYGPKFHGRPQYFGA